MTFEEAGRILELTPGSGPAEARRAYLRLLKRFRPEVDPTGFMRLREAFELTLQVATWQAAAAARAEEAQREEARLEADEDSAPAAASPLADPLADAEQSPPAPVTAPPEASPAAPTLEERWDRVGQLIRRRDLPEAARLAIAALDEGLATASPLGPPPEMMLRFLLDLYEHGHGALALQLQPKFEQWLQAAGQEVAFARSDLAMRWVMVRELGQLPADFPAAVRAALARATLAANPEAAIPELRSFGLADPKEAERATYAMVDRAPLLHSALAFYLNQPSAERQPEPRPAPRRPTSKSGGSRFPIWAIGIAGVTLARLLGSFSGISSPAVRQNDVWVPPPGAIQSQPVQVFSPIAQARAGESAICDAVEDLKRPSTVCATARDLRRAYERGDCGEILALTHLLDERVADPGVVSNITRRTLAAWRSSLDSLARTRCKENASP